MKKIFFILMAVFSLSAGAYADGQIALRAAQDGNLSVVARLKQVAAADVLLARDANNNNVFHLARNMETFQALENAFCTYWEKDCKQRVDALLEERNLSGETPLRRQLNLGHADVYLEYIGRTSLARHIVRARKAKLSGGLLAQSSGEAEANAALQKSRDASGLTDAQMARRLAFDNPAMSRVVFSYRKFAPYLF